ncbi:MAG: ribosome biogenesis GTP-binding protein YihA/YsxC [Bacteroidales bacterium]
MKIHSAEFLISNTKANLCPAPSKAEYAFIGRSNVGKSSLINALCNKKGLAKTSSTPGKTQLINHFIIDNQWYLVDLPGYGYAKVSKTQRAKFQKMIQGYLMNRENLMCTFVLIDSRLEPQKADLEFIDYMGMNGLPFAIAFTKSDKLKQKILHDNIQHYKDVLSENWEELPPIFVTSSEKNRGISDIGDYIEEMNTMYNSL